jgi:hypothetical protein
MGPHGDSTNSRGDFGDDDSISRLAGGIDGLFGLESGVMNCKSFLVAEEANKTRDIQSQRSILYLLKGCS